MRLVVSASWTPVGEELDDGELLPRGREEGVEAGGVEVHGVVPLRRGPGPVADAQRPEGVRSPREGEEDDEDGAECERGSHGSAGAGSHRRGGDPAITPVSSVSPPRRTLAQPLSLSHSGARSADSCRRSHGVGASVRPQGGVRGDGEASVGGRAPHPHFVVGASRADGAEAPGPRRQGRHGRVPQVYFCETIGR